MRTREEAIALLTEWEREDVEYHYHYLPRFLRRAILSARLKSVERRLDAGKLDSYL